LRQVQVRRGVHEATRLDDLEECAGNIDVHTTTPSFGTDLIG
jgi:hypothetical protein